MKHYSLRPVFFFLIVALFPLKHAYGESLYSLGKEASIAYEKGDFAKALSLYIKAQLESPEKPEISYNLGNAQYKNGDYDAALAHYNAALKTGDKQLKQKTRYNMGNAYFRINEYDKAIKEYEETLKLNPGDTDAKKNIEFVKKAKEQKKQEQNSQDKDNKNKDNKDNKDQQNNSNKDKNNDKDKDKNKNDQGQSDEKKDENKKDEPDPGDKNQNDKSGDSNENKGSGQDEKNKIPSGGKNPKTGKAGDDNTQSENMLNRLKDNPGKALIPDYRPRQVEKDW